MASTKRKSQEKPEPRNITPEKAQSKAWDLLTHQHSLNVASKYDLQLTFHEFHQYDNKIVL